MSEVNSIINHLVGLVLEANSNVSVSELKEFKNLLSDTANIIDAFSENEMMKGLRDTITDMIQVKPAFILEHKIHVDLVAFYTASKLAMI